MDNFIGVATLDLHWKSLEHSFVNNFELQGITITWIRLVSLNDDDKIRQILLVDTILYLAPFVYYSKVFLLQPNSGSDKDESINSFLDDPVSVILQSRPRRGAKPYIMRCHSMGPMSMLRRCVWEQTGAPKARRFYQEFPDFYQGITSQISPIRIFVKLQNNLCYVAIHFKWQVVIFKHVR